MRLSDLDTQRLKVTGNIEIADILDKFIESNPNITLVRQNQISDDISLYVLEFKSSDSQKILELFENQRGNNYLFYSVELTANGPDKPTKPIRAA